jgi:hypothetical protein
VFPLCRSRAWQDQLWPLPSLCIADMRAQRTARLCAAAVGGGKATDAPSMALSMGRFGPQTPHRSGWCSVGEWVAVCREVLRISLSHM